MVWYRVCKWKEIKEFRNGQNMDQAATDSPLATWPSPAFQSGLTSDTPRRWQLDWTRAREGPLGVSRAPGSPGQQHTCSRVGGGPSGSSTIQQKVICVGAPLLPSKEVEYIFKGRWPAPLRIYYTFCLCVCVYVYFKLFAISKPIEIR